MEGTNQNQKNDELIAETLAECRAQATHVEEINQHLMQNPGALFSLLGLPSMGMARQMEVGLTQPARDPVRPISQGSNMPDFTSDGFSADVAGTSSGKCGRAAGSDNFVPKRHCEEQPRSAQAPIGRQHKRPTGSLWRKYGQKRVKGIEYEGLEVIR